MLKCKNYSRYKGLREPKCGCEMCRRKYIEQKDLEAQKEAQNVKGKICYLLKPEEIEEGWVDMKRSRLKPTWLK